MKKSYPPVGEATGKKRRVEAMFDAIAPRYDLLNRVLSLGIDRRWRKKAINLLREDQPKRILDVATGTADLALASLSLNPDRVVGIDISEEMLSIGREKIKALGLNDRIMLRRGDAEKLPPSRFRQTASPVLASVHTATPSSLTVNSRPSTRIGDGLIGMFFFCVQRIWLSVTSPWPSTRTASILLFKKQLHM